MSFDEKWQRELTRLALSALDGTNFALAGSGAIREHGIIDRPTRDIDLFTSDLDPILFDRAVDSVVNQFRSLGMQVTELRRAERFAQLYVTTETKQFVEIDMGVDSRESAAVRLEVGPVLNIDDAISNKVSALYSRAETRDYLDVDAIRSAGILSDQQLIEAARERDLGFEQDMFVTQLEGVQKITQQRVADYRVTPAQLDLIKERFLSWAAALRKPSTDVPTSKKQVRPARTSEPPADPSSPHRFPGPDRTGHNLTR